MSKLFKLKKWLTIEEAAKHLSSAFTEAVSEADVLRLALDGRLNVSINIVNPVKVLLGRLVPKADVPYEECVGKNGTAVRRSIFRQHITDDGEIYIFDTREPYYIVRGVCDLPMDEGFRLAVEREYHSLTGGPEICMRLEDGVLIDAGDGPNRLCQFEAFCDESSLPSLTDSVNHFEELFASSPLSPDEVFNELARKLEILRRTSRYCLADRLPVDSVMVVRAEALSDFIRSTNDAPNGSEKQLGTTERGYLLKMIVGMAIDGYGYVPNAAKSVLPRELAAVIVDLKMSITDDTIRKYLKEAVETVLPGKSRQA